MSLHTCDIGFEKTKNCKIKKDWHVELGTLGITNKEATPIWIQIQEKIVNDIGKVLYEKFLKL